MPGIDSSIPEWGRHFGRGVDKAVWMIGDVFWRGKFYSMLAILFGAGIVLMAEKNEKLGVSPAVAHYRRCAGLLVLGLCHAFLVWYGDMLFPYAICGGLAWFFRKLSPRTLLICAVSLLFIEWILLILDYLVDNISDDDSTIVSDEFGYSDYLVGWLAQMPLRANDALGYYSSMLTFAWATVGMMLLGMAMLKLGMLGEVRGRVWLWQRSLRLCTFAWIIAMVSAFCYVNTYTTFFADILPITLDTFTTPALALGYIGLIRAWSAGEGQMGLKGMLESVGRMALSNYLLQSIIATWIFSGHGLGLYGKIGRPEQIVIVVGIWVVLVGFTLAWQRRFSQGPAEYVLRKITGGRNRSFVLANHSEETRG